MTDPTPYRMTATTWALLLLLGLIWGGSYFFGRIAVGHLPPFTLAFFRLSLAALALHIYLRGRFDLYATLRSHWRPFLLLGLLNNAIPHSLILMGQTEIGAGLAAILNATTPIWTVLIANRLTTDEKLTAAKLIGCLLGLLGTVILIGPSTLATSQVPLWALLLPIGASVFLLLKAGSSPIEAGLGSLIMGFGMGAVSTAAMVIVQNAVGWTERGVATASQMFARSLGSTLGATVLGAVLNMNLAAGGTPIRSDQVRALLDHAGQAGGAEIVRSALGHALHLTFWGVFALAVLTFLAALFVPTVSIDGSPGDDRG